MILNKVSFNPPCFPVNPKYAGKHFSNNLTKPPSQRFDQRKIQTSPSSPQAKNHKDTSGT